MQLYSHQQKALDETRDFNRVAYYLDMGLGKTFVGSEKLKSFGTKQNLLICQKSNELNIITDYPYPYWS